MDRKAQLKELGDAVRAIRKEKGMTQEALAHSIGKDRQVIQRLETGNTNPTYTFLKEIAGGLGVAVRDIMPEQ